MRQLAGNLPSPLVANLSEFPTDCRFLQFVLGIDVPDVLHDVRSGGLEQPGHLLLRQPNRFVHEPDFDPGVSVFGLVDDDLALWRGIFVKRRFGHAAIIPQPVSLVQGSRAEQWTGALRQNYGRRATDRAWSLSLSPLVRINAPEKCSWSSAACYYMVECVHRFGLGFPLNKQFVSGSLHSPEANKYHTYDNTALLSYSHLGC